MKLSVEWGRLYICPTPIGNLSDITLRTVTVLGQVDLIACEDTRVSIKLLQRYSIQKPLISYHAHNIESALRKIMIQLKLGKEVALITDAGMPGIQDPGQEIIQAVIREGLEFDVLPGASAVLPAVIYSGFSSNGFLFLGFLPRSGQERKKKLEQSLLLPQAVVLYESPKRILSTLQEIQIIMEKDRQIVLCRELTKIHQEIIRGSVAGIVEELKARETILGEIVLVIEGNPKTENSIPPTVFRCIEYLLQKGYSEKDIVELTSSVFNLKKNLVKRELARRKPPLEQRSGMIHDQD